MITTNPLTSLIEKSERVELEERRTFRCGYHGVFLDPNADHSLEETIYFSDSTSKDNLDVTDPRNDIHVSYDPCP